MKGMEMKKEEKEEGKIEWERIESKGEGEIEKGERRDRGAPVWTWVCECG